MGSVADSIPRPPTAKTAFQARQRRRHKVFVALIDTGVQDADLDITTGHANIPGLVSLDHPNPVRKLLWNTSAQSTALHRVWDVHGISLGVIHNHVDHWIQFKALDFCLACRKHKGRAVGKVVVQFERRRRTAAHRLDCKTVERLHHGIMLAVFITDPDATLLS